MFIVLRYILSVPLSLAMKLLAVILSPILAGISVLFKVNKLPGFLGWFHTLDDDLDGGQHQNGWPANVSWFKLWLQRTYWIMRNPAAGFNHVVLGMASEGLTITHLVTDQGEYKYYNVRMTNAKGQRFFSILWDLHMFGSRYCKIWVGWTWKDEKGQAQMFKFDFNPFKSKG